MLRVVEKKKACLSGTQDSKKKCLSSPKTKKKDRGTGAETACGRQSETLAAAKINKTK
jgi:hypothetical protein